MTRTLTQSRAYAFIQAYLESTDRSVYDVYERPSYEKVNAERKIKWEMLEEGGKDYRVISHNTFMFTCGYTKGNDLHVFTNANEYIIYNAFGSHITEAEERGVYLFDSM